MTTIKRQSILKLSYAFLALNLIFAYILYIRGYEAIHMNLAIILPTILFIWRTRTYTQSEYANNEDEAVKKPHVNKILFSILFMGFYTLSIYSLHFTNYIKPVIPIFYYIFISFASVVVCIEILFIETKKDIVSNLLKSFLLALNLRLCFQIILPYGIAEDDAIYHISIFSKQIVQNGYIPDGYTYTPFPALHIINAVTSIISSLNLWTISCWIAGVITSFGVFFCFLLGRKFANVEIGLFAALLYAICDHLIQKSFMQPMTLAIPLVLLILYLTLSVKESKKISWAVLSFLSLFVLIITHHYSSVVFILFLLALVEVQCMSQSKLNILHNLKPYKFLTVSVLYTVVILFYWVFVHFYMLEWITNVGMRAAEVSIGEIIIQPERRYFVTLLNTFGFYTLIFFSAYGLLDTFTRPLSTFKLIIIFICINLTVGFALSTIVPSAGGSVAHRWLAFLELGCIFLASWGLTSVFKKKQNYSRIAYFAIILFVMTFFMTASASSCGDLSPIRFGNPAYTVETLRSMYLTQSSDWIGNHISEDSNISSELRYKLGKLAKVAKKYDIYSSTHGSISSDSHIIPFKRLPFDETEINTTEISQGAYIFSSKTNSFNDCNKLYGNGIIEIYKKETVKSL